VAPTIAGSPNILILYGTGWKNASASNVQVTIGNAQVGPAYVGPSSVPGLDRMNVAVATSAGASDAPRLDLSDAPDSTTGAYRTRTVQFCLAGQNGGSACPSPVPRHPSCNEPLPGIAAPYAPHGVFALVSQGANPVPVSNYILNQPTVCGADLSVVWSQIDKENGIYDWIAPDNPINQWVRSGKIVNLIVRAVSDARPNNGTPTYILNDPNHHSVTCQENGLTLQYPVCYTDSYESNYKTFIQAVLNRDGANRSVGYIRVGLARGGEVFPTCLQEMINFSGLNSTAQFDAQWENYITEMTAFQKTPQSSGPRATPCR
jgi:hypothetical protein